MADQIAIYCQKAFLKNWRAIFSCLLEPIPQALTKFIKKNAKTEYELPDSLDDEEEEPDGKDEL